jgi:hypothetical protein
MLLRNSLSYHSLIYTANLRGSFCSLHNEKVKYKYAPGLFLNSHTPCIGACKRSFNLLTARVYICYNLCFFKNVNRLSVKQRSKLTRDLAIYVMLHLYISLFPIRTGLLFLYPANQFHIREDLLYRNGYKYVVMNFGIVKDIMNKIKILFCFFKGVLSD